MKKIAWLLTAFILVSSSASCFLNPFRGSSESEPTDEQFPNDEQAVVKDQAFIFGDTSEVDYGIIQEIGDIKDRIIRIESMVRSFSSMGSARSFVTDDIVIWPRDENVWFTVSYNKKDKIGRRSRLKIHPQWRQISNEKDSDWYDMKYRAGLEIDDNDYILTDGRNGEPDTVIVRVSIMREIDQTENAIWYFRTRIESGRKYSEWDSVGYGIKLVDPLTLQTVSKPEMEMVK